MQRDVLVVGLDDIPAGRRPAYLLTAVTQPFEEMAWLAAQTLRSQVDDPGEFAASRLLPGALIERGSAQLLPERQRA